MLNNVWIILLDKWRYVMFDWALKISYVLNYDSTVVNNYSSWVLDFYCCWVIELTVTVTLT